jgi:hypothetical protein
MMLFFKTAAVIDILAVPDPRLVFRTVVQMICPMLAEQQKKVPYVVIALPPVSCPGEAGRVFVPHQRFSNDTTAKSGLMPPEAKVAFIVYEKEPFIDQPDGIEDTPGDHLAASIDDVDLHNVWRRTSFETYDLALKKAFPQRSLQQY